MNDCNIILLGKKSFLLLHKNLRRTDVKFTDKM